jgi:hypothetical protein
VQIFHDALGSRRNKKIRDPNLSLSADAQQVILIRLANEIDEHLDLGMLYCSKDKTTELGVNFSTVVELAKKIGDASLADMLEDVLTETNSARVPEALRRAEVSSFVITNISLLWMVGHSILATFNYLISFTRRTTNFLRLIIAEVARHGLVKRKRGH